MASTGQLIVGVSPFNASNKNVTYSTDAASVARVNATGLVAAIGPGTTTIRVTTVDGGFEDTCEVTVMQTATPISDIILTRVSGGREWEEMPGSPGGRIYRIELYDHETFVVMVTAPGTVAVSGFMNVMDSRLVNDGGSVTATLWEDVDDDADLIFRLASNPAITATLHISHIH